MHHFHYPYSASALVCSGRKISIKLVAGGQQFDVRLLKQSCVTYLHVKSIQWISHRSLLGGDKYGAVGSPLSFR